MFSKKEYYSTYLNPIQDKKSANFFVIAPKGGEKYYITNEKDYQELINYCTQNNYSLTSRYINNLSYVVIDIDQKHKEQVKIDKELMFTTLSNLNIKILEWQTKNRNKGIHIVLDIILDGRTTEAFTKSKLFYRCIINHIINEYEVVSGIRLNNNEIDPAPISTGIRPPGIINCRNDKYIGSIHPVVFDKEPTVFTQDILREIHKIRKQDLENKNKYEKFEPTIKDNSTLIELLDEIPNKYWDKYDSWFKLITIIKKQYGKNYVNGLSVAHEYSQKSCKYNSGSVDLQYENCDFNAKIGIPYISTLIGKRKFKSIITTYKKQVVSKNNPFVDQFGCVTNILIAEFVYSIYKDKTFYVCNDGWYILNDNNYWVKEQEKFPKWIVKINKLVSDKLFQLNQIEEIGDLIIHQILDRITRFSGLQDVMKLSIPLFSIDNLDEFDSKPNLIAFKNGVYDLKTASFRPTTPNDKLTQFINYEYKNISDNNKLETIKQDFIRVFNDNPIYFENAMKWIGYNITGEVGNKMFMVHTGVEGDCGKTTMFDILSLLLPIYTKNQSAIMISKGFGSASEEYKKLSTFSKNWRCLFINEIDDKQLDIQTIKKLTDPHPVLPRPAFGQVKETILDVKFKLNIITQKSLEFEEDGGMRSRGNQIKYHNKFSNVIKHTTYGLGKVYTRKNIVSDLEADEIYKYTMLNFILSKGVEYYQSDGEVIFSNDDFKNNFLECCKNNKSIYKEFVMDNFQITRNPNDMVYKQEIMWVWRFLNNYTEMSNKDFRKVNKVLSQLFQIKYDRGAGITNSARLRKVNKRGRYEGIKITNQDYLDFNSCQIPISDSESDCLEPKKPKKSKKKRKFHIIK